MKRKKSLVGYIPKRHYEFDWKKEFKHRAIITQVESSRKIISIPLVMTKPYWKVKQKVRITIEEI